MLEETKNKIKIFITDTLLNNEIAISFDSNLYSSGLLGSLAHLKLVAFIERTFEISIPMNEVSLENFDTIDQISEFIESILALNAEA